MAKDLILSDVINVLSNADNFTTVAIGVDSVIINGICVYNLSIIIRFSGDRACTIFTKDIEDSELDPVFIENKEVILLLELYNELRTSVGERKITLSTGIHEKWFNRYKFQGRTKRLKIEGCYDH